MALYGLDLPVVWGQMHIPLMGCTGAQAEKMQYVFKPESCSQRNERPPTCLLEGYYYCVYTNLLITLNVGCTSVALMWVDELARGPGDACCIAGLHL
jgi:hypothetical protein